MTRSEVVAWLRGAILLGPVELPRGQTADCYFDEYRIISNPGALTACSAAMSELFSGAAQSAALAGVATAGIPFATLVSQRTHLPLFVVRPKPRGYGTATAVEGGDVAHMNVTVIDSVLGTGMAALGAVRVLRAGGAIVTRALFLLDRERGGTQALDDAGVAVATVTTWSELYADVAT